MLLSTRQLPIETACVSVSEFSSRDSSSLRFSDSDPAGLFLLVPRLGGRKTGYIARNAGRGREFSPVLVGFRGPRVLGVLDPTYLTSYRSRRVRISRRACWLLIGLDQEEILDSIIGKQKEDLLMIVGVEWNPRLMIAGIRRGFTLEILCIAAKP